MSGTSECPTCGRRTSDVILELVGVFTVVGVLVAVVWYLTVHLRWTP
jgi:hypothetical protein